MDLCFAIRRALHRNRRKEKKTKFIKFYTSVSKQDKEYYRKAKLKLPQSEPPSTTSYVSEFTKAVRKLSTSSHVN